MSDKSPYTFVYLFIREDERKIYLNKDQAINASLKDPYAIVEIFGTNCAYAGYETTHEYYKGGILYKNNEKTI